MTPNLSYNIFIWMATLEMAFMVFQSLQR